MRQANENWLMSTAATEPSGATASSCWRSVWGWSGVASRLTATGSKGSRASEKKALPFDSIE